MFSTEAYNIPHGVFMFLGYSETDENLLKPHNNLTVVDAVSSLDNFMREEVNNQVRVLNLPIIFQILAHEQSYFYIQIFYYFRRCVRFFFII